MPLNTAQKAAIMTTGLRQEAAMLRQKGEAEAANRLEAAVNECPVESLARLYDLIRETPYS